MVGTIGTAKDRVILHDRCGEEVARVINGAPTVKCIRRECKEDVVLGDFIERGPLQEAFDLILSGQVSPADVIALCDPLAKYRNIEELFIVGPQELDTLFRIDSGNPLSLREGWIPQPPSIDPRTDAWIRSCIWRDSPEWKTRAALILVPPMIGDIPTSLVGQNKLLGVQHDGVASGIIRKDVFWSNYFISPGFDWANVPAVGEWSWLLVYEHPFWTARNCWEGQEELSAQKGMPISSAPQDTWALNMLKAVYGVSWRINTWSRTSTLRDGNPLRVYSK